MPVDFDKVDAQDGSAFFALPGEVRNEIYRRCFDFEDADFDDKKVESFSLLGYQSNWERKRPSLDFMISCKRMYLEMRDISPGCAAQAALRCYRHMNNTYCGIAFRGKYAWADLTRFAVLVCIQERPYYERWLALLPMALDKMPHLRELSFDWYCNPTGSWIRTAEDHRAAAIARYYGAVEDELEKALLNKASLKTIYFRGMTTPKWLDSLRARDPASRPQIIYDPAALAPWRPSKPIDDGSQSPIHRHSGREAFEAEMVRLALASNRRPIPHNLDFSNL